MKFSQKIQGLVLGLIGLIDVKGIDVAQPMYREAIRHKVCSSNFRSRPFLLLWPYYRFLEKFI